LRIFRHAADVPADAQGAAVAIGNFDGLHPGHRLVIGRAQEAAKRLGAPAGVLTFEPHPRQFFQPDAPCLRLTPFRPKARLLQAMGLDLMFALAFDAALAGLSPEAFVAEILAKALGLKHVVVGYDFVFGKKRAGDAKRLIAEGARHGIAVDVIEPVTAAGGTIYSSTKVREALLAGDAAGAASILGREWEIEGHVQAGDRRGRTIGFATANLMLEGYLTPRHGVYAVKAWIEDDPTPLKGVANIGRRPTFGGGGVLLETHLFDFATDIYGKHMRVALVDFIREERKFPGLEALKAQIETDGAAARRILAA